MRLWALVTGVALAAGVPVAHAESGEAMRARGEQLAKDGRYSEAIDAFKAAEKLEPRARHSCLIALAYLRRESWPQAEIFLEQCEKRATPGDPAPEWVPAAKQQLIDRLANVNVAPVAIKVEPADVAVKLAVSSFALDELFEPRTIHLPPGRHVVIATAPGYQDAQQTVTVTDKTPQTITITLAPATTTQPPGPGGDKPISPPPPPAAAPSKVPWIVMGAGLGVGLVGVGIQAFPMRTARADWVDAHDATPYDAAAETDARDRFHKWRKVAIALEVAGGAALITGVVLKYTVFDGKEAPAQVALTPLDEGGGMVSVGWSR